MGSKSGWDYIMNLYLFVMVMDRLTDKVRKASPSTMFSDSIMICGENGEQVEESL